MLSRFNRIAVGASRVPTARSGVTMQGFATMGTQGTTQNTTQGNQRTTDSQGYKRSQEEQSAYDPHRNDSKRTDTQRTDSQRTDSQRMDNSQRIDSQSNQSAYDAQFKNVSSRTSDSQRMTDSQSMKDTQRTKDSQYGEMQGSQRSQNADRMQGMQNPQDPKKMSGSFEDEIRSLADLNYSASEAYGAAMNRLENAKHKEKFSEFQKDYRRREKELRDLLSSRGIDHPRQADTRFDPTNDSKQWLSKGKTDIENMVGDKAILSAMKSNLKETSSAYKRLNDRKDKWSEADKLIERGISEDKKRKEWFESL